MKAAVEATFEFGASHTAASCEHSDGHLWIVTATIDGDINWRTGMVIEPAILVDAFHRLVTELSGTNLNDMLPGVTTTPEGLAAYIRERLLADAPISGVSVDMRPGYRIRLEWPRR